MIKPPALSFFLKSKEIISYTGTPDIIIVYSAHPFHYLPLERIARKYKAQIIFEVRDLWPLSLIKLLNFSQWNPLVFTLSRIEKRAYQHSDHVVSLLKNALPYMESKGLAKSKYKVIPNGISVQLFSERETHGAIPQELEEKIDTLKRAGYFLLAYPGSIGKPNALDYLVEAMSILDTKKVIVHCLIVGKGELKNELQRSASHLDNISFVPPIKKTEIPAFLNKMDALYIGWNNSDLYQYGISPNKIFDYMMSGRPIVESCVRSASFVHLFKCGLCCEPENFLSIAEAITKMSLFSATELHDMGKNGREAVVNYFDYKVLADEYMSIFRYKTDRD